MISTNTSKTKKKNVHYVNNMDFLDALVKYRKECDHAKENNLDRPRIPEYIGECFIKIATHYAFKPNFANYCVDAKTTILSQRGWLNYNNLKKDDIVLSYDFTSEALVWTPIQDIFINPSYKGHMYSLTSDLVDMLITPNHRVLTVESGLVKIEDVTILDNLILSGNPVDPSNCKPYSNQEVSTFREEDLSIELILSLTQNQRIMLINNIKKQHTSNERKVVKRMTTQLVNLFSMLCCISGINISSYQDESHGWDVTSFVLHDLTERFTDLNDIKVNKIKYKGTVWCPTTAHGSFMCSRNGKTFLTGNSYKEDLISDAVENMSRYILNFNPEKSTNPFAYFTQITYFAFLRRIKLEKKETEKKQMIIEKLNFNDVMTDDGDDNSNYSDYSSIRDNISIRNRIK